MPKRFWFVKLEAFWLTTELRVEGRSGSDGTAEALVASADGNEAVMAEEDMGVLAPVVAVDVSVPSWKF
jgi:hypothetical protein